MIKTDHGNRRQLALRETAKVGCSLWKINKDSFRIYSFVIRSRSDFNFDLRKHVLDYCRCA